MNEDLSLAIKEYLLLLLQIKNLQKEAETRKKEIERLAKNWDFNDLYSCCERSKK